MSKKSQSEIISSVLLILMAVTAAVVIMVFIIPFIKERTQKDTCLDVANKVSIANNLDYTCYEKISTPGLSNMSVQIHIDDISDKIKGFAVEMGGANSKSFKILNNTATTNVTMYDGSLILKIPEDNTEITYKIKIDPKPEFVRVYPILKNGKSCSSPSVINSVELCL